MRMWYCKICRVTIIEYDEGVEVHCMCKMKLPGTWTRLGDEE